MEKRRLGQSDLHLAPIMLGGNVFGWMIDEKTSFGILDAFIDAGFNAIDTSDSYARWLPGSPGGESETIIGSWLKRSGNRDRVLIETRLYPARVRGPRCDACKSITSIFTRPISTTRSPSRKRRCRPTRSW
jgi:aryl-alcohol dehydrogenase-like predicted oxidoreductase